MSDLDTRFKWVNRLMMVSTVMALVVLVEMVVLVFRTLTPPDVLTLAAGQSEGNTTFVGIHGESLWLEKGVGRPFTSYSPVFPVPGRVGVHIALAGEVYAVVSIDPFADEIRLKQV